MQGMEQVELEGDGLLGEGEEILSQKDFVPTPFFETAWEVVGERIPDNGFIGLEIDIIHSEMTRPDPMFQDFGGNVQAEQGKVLHAGQSADQMEEKEPISEELIAALKAEAFEEGRQAGILEGTEAAQSEAKEQNKNLLEQLNSFQDEVRQQLALLASKTERSALELALAVSRKILSTTAEVRADYILDVIKNALHSTAGGNPLRIRVSPQDYEFLQVIGLPPELSTEETGVQYVADDGVSAGCVVETDFGEVDLRLEQMWQQVKENLYEVLK